MFSLQVAQDSTGLPAGQQGLGVPEVRPLIQISRIQPTHSKNFSFDFQEDPTWTLLVPSHLKPGLFSSPGVQILLFLEAQALLHVKIEEPKIKSVRNLNGTDEGFVASHRKMLSVSTLRPSYAAQPSVLRCCVLQISVPLNPLKLEISCTYVPIAEKLVKQPFF